MSTGDKVYTCKKCNGQLEDLRFGYCLKCKEQFLQEKHLCQCGCGTLINRWHFKHLGNLREVRYIDGHGRYKQKIQKYDDPIKAIRNNTCPICFKVMYDKRTLHRHIDKDRCMQKEQMQVFKSAWKHTCHCGCGVLTKAGRLALPGHDEGEPWNKGLTKHDDQRLMVNSIRRIKEMSEHKNLQYMANTSIEIIMKKIFDHSETPYIQQYSFFYKYLCDFAIPQLKLIIECDGDYWHNYPHGTEKDREQNEFVASKGWHILRFWERDIKNDIDKCILSLNNKIEELQGGFIN